MYMLSCCYRWQRRLVERQSTLAGRIPGRPCWQHADAKFHASLGHVATTSTRRLSSRTLGDEADQPAATAPSYPPPSGQLHAPVFLVPDGRT